MAPVPRVRSALPAVEIRARERNGAIEFPKGKLRAGDRVQIISSLLAGRRGRYAGEGLAPAHHGAAVAAGIRAPGAA